MFGYTCTGHLPYLLSLSSFFFNFHSSLFFIIIAIKISLSWTQYKIYICRFLVFFYEYFFLLEIQIIQMTSLYSFTLIHIPNQQTHRLNLYILITSLTNSAPSRKLMDLPYLSITQ